MKYAAYTYYDDDSFDIGVFDSLGEAENDIRLNILYNGFERFRSAEVIGREADKSVTYDLTNIVFGLIAKFKKKDITKALIEAEEEAINYLGSPYSVIVYADGAIKVVNQYDTCDRKYYNGDDMPYQVVGKVREDDHSYYIAVVEADNDEKIVRDTAMELFKDRIDDIISGWLRSF